MNPIDKEGWSSLTHSTETVEKTHHIPDTPQTRSKAYRLAFTDDEFMLRRELRPVRLQLELLKPDMILEERGIQSTVVMFGGARIPEPGGHAWAAKNEHQAKRLEANSVYYEEARQFARIVSEHSASTAYRDFVVCTGGGPGVMEAGSRGAAEVGAPSIGLNIVLPHEQAPNEYVTPELCFNFHYFAIRKMHFLMRAKAVAAFPGGFGTMDELFRITHPDADRAHGTDADPAVRFGILAADRQPRFPRRRRHDRARGCQPRQPCRQRCRGMECHFKVLRPELKRARFAPRPEPE
jgi:predicted Rossmann-fold nucleotide-binding protein